MHILLALLVAGCPAPTRSDDDDATTDDDDTVADDDDTVADDDDTVADDDDAAPFDDTVLTFRFELDVAATDVDGVLFVDFADESGTLQCRQRLLFEGSVAFGAGLISDCPACTGAITVDDGSVLDLTNPAVDAEDCEPGWIQGSGLNYGGGMLTPRDAGGFGDLLEIGLIDIDRFEALALTVDRANQYDAEALRDAFEASGTAFAQVGYLADAAGSVADGTDFGAVAQGAGPGGDDWLAAWQIYRNPAVNPYDGLDMQGAYLGRMLWNVTDSW